MVTSYEAYLMRPPNHPSSSPFHSWFPERIGGGIGNTQNNGWMSVPAFGDWDLKNGLPDYSLDFSKIREMRKQNKRDISRASLGNEEDLNPSQHHHQSQSQDHRPREEEVYELLPLLYRSMKCRLPQLLHGL
ncbi:hypothetical protein COCNU_scaffold006205G000020 [Cocos nucifera]|nr:hypothetical protein [Cocos nucifera]